MPDSTARRNCASFATSKPSASMHPNALSTCSPSTCRAPAAPSLQAASSSHTSNSHPPLALKHLLTAGSCIVARIWSNATCCASMVSMAEERYTAERRDAGAEEHRLKALRWPRSISMLDERHVWEVGGVERVDEHMEPRRRGDWLGLLLGGRAEEEQHWELKERRGEDRSGDVRSELEKCGEVKQASGGSAGDPCRLMASSSSRAFRPRFSPRALAPPSSSSRIRFLAPPPSSAFPPPLITLPSLFCAASTSWRASTTACTPSATSTFPNAASTTSTASCSVEPTSAAYVACSVAWSRNDSQSEPASNAGQ
mmetsp:Transcript_58371/g.137398  ORF Transcript_58371/g.137398 Transcript_58371/m.137398 type:complete len:312 (-) Transcript_58371:1326-2261(-)